MRFLARRRRSPIVAAGLLVAALSAIGIGYAAIGNVQSAQAAVGDQTQIEEGEQLFIQGCSSCHGLGAQGTQTGPTLIGVGAAAANFQLSTGRMPLAAPGAQAPENAPTYTEEQIAALAAFIGSLGPGPAIPSEEQIDYSDADVALGGELFRINCSQCHQAAGQGGALTQGKYAPSLMKATPREIYEAMITGPQSMPVFSDAQIPTEDKQAIIAYIRTLQEQPAYGGLTIGKFGPVTEGVFLAVGAFAILIAAAIWIGIKAR